jgi:hypothetical protein
MGMRQVGHLDCAKHDPAGPAAGNSRNGTLGKWVLAELGTVEVPRDRAGA